MSKPYIHALSSAKRYGSSPESYIDIHNFLDSSKGVFADQRHRTVFHNAFGIFVAEKMFGVNYAALNALKAKYNLPGEAIDDILAWKRECYQSGAVLKNDAGKLFSVRDIAEQHILEDFGNKFIPTLGDYLENMEMAPWMNNGQGSPPSNAKIAKREKFVVLD